MDDAAAEFAGAAVRVVGGVAFDLVTEVVFSRYSARYFHGIGRRVIALVIFGRKRIPSSLRQVPKGSMPKPRTGDWWALFVGIGTWLAAAGGVVSAFLI